MGTLILTNADTNYRLSDLIRDGAVKPPAPVGALAGAGAGNVENGDHGYVVTWVTAQGESLPGAAVVVTVVNKAADGKVALSGIAIGPPGTASRKVYRTVAAGAVYKLLTTLADNATTVYVDNTADANLGAVAPANDLSGLPYPSPYWDNVGIIADEANTAPVLLGDGTLSAANWDESVDPGAGSNRFMSGDVPLMPSSIYVRSAMAGAIIHVSGVQR